MDTFHGAPACRTHVATALTNGLGQRLPGSTEGFLKEICQRSGLVVLDITPEIAALAFHVPPDFPNDPADRLISATARAHGLRLVTKDQYMQDSPLLRTIW